jgi:hypothetical protein
MNNFYRCRYVLVLCVACIILSCESERSPLQPLQESKIPVEYEIGQKWLYKRTFINIGLSQFMDYPDTILGYAFYEVVDTQTIDDSIYFIIDGIDFDIGKTSVDTILQKWAVFISDSILKVLEYETGGFGFSQGPFKQRALSISFPARLRQSLYKKAHVNYLPGFRDEVYPLHFPLVKNQKWVYRYGKESQDTENMYRKYMGQENISVPAGYLKAYKIDWLLSEYWADQLENASDLAGFDWYDSKGLIKRFFQYGKSTVTDSLGTVIGTITQSYDILEFLGEFRIDPDTLHTYGE